MLMLIIQHSFDHDPFDVFMLFNCYLENVLMLKVELKIMTIIFTWISKIMYQDGSTMLHAIYHVIDV